MSSHGYACSSRWRAAPPSRSHWHEPRGGRAPAGVVNLHHLPHRDRRSRPQPGNVRTLLELYGVTGAERDGLIQLTREARQPGWWHSFRDVLPNPYKVYIGLEAGAASIRNFEPSVIPGLLQTADYARETFRNGPIELTPMGSNAWLKSAWPGRRS